MLTTAKAASIIKCAKCGGSAICGSSVRASYFQTTMMRAWPLLPIAFLLPTTFDWLVEHHHLGNKSFDVAYVD